MDLPIFNINLNTSTDEESDCEVSSHNSGAAVELGVVGEVTLDVTDDPIQCHSVKNTTPFYNHVASCTPPEPTLPPTLPLSPPPTFSMDPSQPPPLVADSSLTLPTDSTLLPFIEPVLPPTTAIDPTIPPPMDPVSSQSMEPTFIPLQTMDSEPPELQLIEVTLPPFQTMDANAVSMEFDPANVGNMQFGCMPFNPDAIPFESAITTLPPTMPPPLPNMVVADYNYNLPFAAYPPPPLPPLSHVEPVVEPMDGPMLAPMLRFRPAVFPTLVVSASGLLTVFLQNDIEVEMTLDRAIRLVNRRHRAIAASSGSGSTTCLFHTAAKLFHDVNQVDGDIYWERRVRLSHDDLIFSNSETCYRYHDNAMQPSDHNFRDVAKDLSITILFSSSGYGPHLVGKFEQLSQRARYYYHRDGSTTVFINGVKIHQSLDGDTTVTHARKCLRGSPRLGSMSVESAAASMRIDKEWGVHVQCGMQTLIANFATLVLSDGKYVCGFDEFHEAFIQLTANIKRDDTQCDSDPDTVRCPKNLPLLPPPPSSTSPRNWVPNPRQPVAYPPRRPYHTAHANAYNIRSPPTFARGRWGSREFFNSGMAPFNGAPFPTNYPRTVSAYSGYRLQTSSRNNSRKPRSKFTIDASRLERVEPHVHFVGEEETSVCSEDVENDGDAAPPGELQKKGGSDEEFSVPVHLT